MRCLMLDTPDDLSEKQRSVDASLEAHDVGSQCVPVDVDNLGLLATVIGSVLEVVHSPPALVAREFLKERLVVSVPGVLEYDDLREIGVEAVDNVFVFFVQEVLEGVDDPI